MPWKKAKNAYRLTIKVENPDDEENPILIMTEDVLVSELDPDNMTDFYAFYNWFGDEGWEIINVEEIFLWEWKDMCIKNKWRGFYDNFGNFL
jgi:hypothetical protein